MMPIIADQARAGGLGGKHSGCGRVGL